MTILQNKFTKLNFDILITETGHENLTDFVPKTVKAIEKIMGKNLKFLVSISKVCKERGPRLAKKTTPSVEPSQ